ncbi:hypothetical protein [Arcticibacter tournemirensis]|uniref:Lipoprotein n=1 Tax=Arcticibacter tournemirensis TaxID=699437 RepID=A0A4V1KIS1_9SPHI|nr:hypothetical protein [Arcticibacter tournemirensis]KAA8481693.1 hypothetical protein F1649_14255 [Arcticibacter tournemirensis]RXF71672.1 hypothetical protein EKH83_03005 [Arcticibacter tournemirensis]
MKGSYIICFALAIGLSACKNSKKNVSGNDLTEQLKEQKYNTDRQISDSSLIVLVKVKGEKNLVRVENKRYPRNIETTYNVLKDKKGRIIYLAELPYSETSEWFIAYKSYYDSTGNLYAFQRINNFLNNGCTRGAAMENMLKYYDSSFKVLDSVYTLTDTYKKPLDKGACKFPYNFPYSIFKTIKEYKESKGIPVL